jgi:predicted PurR-regulated permease PerM
MSVFDQRTAKVLATICAFVAIGVFLYEVRHTLVVILFAVLFAYLLEPIVYRIERSRLARGSRWLAILETYLAIGAILAVLGILFGPKLVEDTRLLSQSLPGLLEKVTSGKIVWQFGNRYGWSYDTQLKIEQFIAAHQAEILAWSEEAGTAVAKMLQNMIWVVLIPILAIFFLRDARRFSATLLHIFGKSNQRRFLRLIMTDLDVMLAHFIRAQLILAGISLVIYSVVLTALRFPYALALGFAAGAMEFIPVIGPLVAALVIVLVRFLTTYPHLWALILFFAVWGVVQDYFVSPRVMSGTLELHPLAAIAAVLMGGELGGVVGVYLSIPVVAAIRIVWVRWQKYSAVIAPAAPPVPADGVLSTPKVISKL